MEVECKFCKKVFKGQKDSKFCSLSCSAKFNNVGKNRWEGKENQLPKSRICKSCGSEFSVSRSNRHNTNCKGCIDKRTYNKPSLKNSRCDKSRKRNLIDECGHLCSICNNEEWMDKPIPLELDHIDGDHTNNERDNLRLICPNCHAQTKTYKGRNKGNGRKWRRDRYLKVSNG